MQKEMSYWMLATFADRSGGGFVRGTAVLRWQYRPGSTLYFVWTQERSGSGPNGSLVMVRSAVKGKK